MQDPDLSFFKTPVAFGPADPDEALRQAIVDLTDAISENTELLRRMAENDEAMRLLSESLFPSPDAPTIDAEQLDWFVDQLGGFFVREADGSTRSASDDETKAIKARYPKASSPRARGR